jgi:hypothetical protein
MSCSSTSRFFTAFCPGVQCIRGGDWSNLMQGGHPIVFESQKLSESEKLYSIYDKEMLAIMHALMKFRQYLVGSRFVVKTDHNNLKYFLDQKDLSERQQKWVSKVQAFDFDIEYVKGKRNVVADSLSKRLASCSMMRQYHYCHPTIGRSHPPSTLTLTENHSRSKP